MPFKTYQRYIVALVPLVIFGIIAYHFSDILTYIILAWVLSMIGAPVNGLLKNYVGKNLAAILTLSSFLVLFIVLLWMFVPTLVQQARNFGNIEYSRLIANLEEPVNDWRQWLIDKGLLDETVPAANMDSLRQEAMNHEKFSVIRVDSLLRAQGDTSRTGITLVINMHDHELLLNDAENDTQQSPATFFDHVKNNLYQFFDPSRIPALFGSIIGFFGNLLIAVMSTFFIAFFFLREHGLFSQMIKALVPNEYEEQTVHAIDQTTDLLIRYFIGIVIQITIITLLVSVVLSFLGFKNALLIGFFAALMNVIPYIGPLLGAMFGIIITVSSNLDAQFYQDLLPLILILVVVFALMQLMDNLILQPNIFSKSVKAHPLEIFIVILMGAKLGGILGMIIAIPTYTIIRVIAKVFLSEFKIVQRITRGM